MYSDKGKNAMRRRDLTALTAPILMLALSTLGNASADEIFRDCDKCPEMVVVPAGSFMMGSTDAAAELSVQKGYVQYEPVLAWEKPRHQVEIAKPFALGRYEITLDQWEACVADAGCNGHRPDDEGWGGGRRPVINVSWKEAKAYVAWLSDKTGQSYRLPSEAEWEYAARAGTTTLFSWGDDIKPESANYGLSLGSTVEVGAYPPNPWGLHDMHGNVSEWVADCKVEGYEGAPRDGGVWTSGECTFSRAIRGGGWENLPGLLRSASRSWEYPGARSHSLGFRVARSLQ